MVPQRSPKPCAPDARLYDSDAVRAPPRQEVQDTVGRGSRELAGLVSDKTVKKMRRGLAGVPWGLTPRGVPIAWKLNDVGRRANTVRLGWSARPSRFSKASPQGARVRIARSLGTRKTNQELCNSFILLRRAVPYLGQAPPLVGGFRLSPLLDPARASPCGGSGGPYPGCVLGIMLWPL